MEIYCPYCGTRVDYKEPKQANSINDYPKCSKCDTYIQLIKQDQNYVVRQIRIMMTNC